MSAALSVSEKTGLARIRELADSQAPAAIKTLASLMKSRKVTPACRVSAAKAILEFAHGRPAHSSPLVGDGGGLTINILKLARKLDTHHKVIDVTPAEAQAAADNILNEVEAAIADGD